ncbi:helix-turn-helix transcriptional regulator [Oribacterium sp. FC2011]|uniref:helix-turn-helix transcriptional regulator n=1 Tax=Oribacterium sp. FC2011 TaxID=1408311 RepID=UPI0004E0FB3D|nr:WYL domain-containing protein [Oribacterium sp. FC2011]
MYATGNKKMLNMLILEILRNYTDEEHALTQQEIIKLLKLNYGMDCDRRAVKNNVLSLKELGDDCGFEISMEKGYRLLSREFDDAELRILIDSVLFSKSISSRQAKDLIKKIRSLASKYFNAKVSHVCNLPDLNRTLNKQALYSVDTINDAISDKKKISFIYNYIGTDFKLHPRREDPYVVNPYQIVANNGKFYLISNYDKYDNIAHFRIDRMTDVHELDEKAKPIKDVPEFDGRLNLPKHMAEHFYMFSGKSVSAKIKTTEDMMSELVDWFGTDFKILEKNADSICIRVTCNQDALRYWALQYGPYVEIIEPESLRNRIIDDINNMKAKYSLS